MRTGNLTWHIHVHVTEYAISSDSSLRDMYIPRYFANIAPTQHKNTLQPSLLTPHPLILHPSPLTSSPLTDPHPSTLERSFPVPSGSTAIGGKGLMFS